MTQDSTSRDSQTDLVDALRSGVLSGPLAQQGRDILDQIRKPLRLSVLGLPGTGKSTLMNLLMGAPVVPVGAGLPTLSMSYGDESVARYTMPDGSKRETDAHDLAGIALRKPIFVEATMPLPALGKLSVMEVVAGASAAEQKRALSWAAKRTDIALWCSQGFTAQEFGLWDLMPDHVQDHSFLLLSKADLLASNNSLAGLLEDANDAAGDRFRQVLPIHGEGAIAATKPDGSVDKEALRRSGGVALISAILREVDLAKRAASDKADVFLRQIDYDPDARDAAPEVVQPIASPTRAPAATAPEVPKPADAPASETAVAEAPAPQAPPGQVAPEKAPEPSAAPAQATTPAIANTNAPGPAEPISAAAREACTQAAAQLEAEGEALAVEMTAGRLTPDAVLEVSVDTISWLAEYLGESGAANDPVLKQVRATANDAADLVQLIQLETGGNVAVDAVSLMVQLKQELLAQIAA